MMRRLYHLLLISAVFMIVFIPVLHLAPTTLHAQTPPYWGVQRDGSNNLQFYLNPSGTNQAAAMTIRNDGNLGVNNVNPSNKFMINTTTANDGINLQAGSNTWAALLGNLGGGSYNGIVSAGDRGILFGGASAGNTGGGFVITPWNAVPGGIKVGGDGNVGIRNPNPTAPLEVGYTANLNTPGHIRTSTRDGGSGSRSWDFGASYSLFGNYGFNIKDAGLGAPSLNIAYGTGNVGIGTIAPNERLDISDNGGSDGIVFTQQAENSHSIQTYIDGQWASRASYAGACCNALLLQPDVGSVAIGMSGGQYNSYYPLSAKLDILTGGDDTIPAIRMRQSNAPTYGFDIGIDNNVDGGLYFYGLNNNAQTLAMRIRRDNGKIGIKTPVSPQADLQIKQSTDSQYSGGIMIQPDDVGANASNPGSGAVFYGDDNRFYFMNAGGWFAINQAGKARLVGTLGMNGWEPEQCGAAMALCLIGNGYSSTAWISPSSSSDLRYKKDVQDYEGSLAKVLGLNTVSFKFDTDKFPEKKFPTDTRVGFIAQEVEKIVPEIVNTDDAGYKSIEYGNLTPFLTEAIKDQQKQIEDQKKINEEQSKQLKSLQEELLMLKREIEALKK